MTSREEMDILKAAQAGDPECREKIVKDNTGLVKSIALKYHNGRYDFEDIVQLGMLGLLKAIKKFDFSYGVRFSTYAVPMISGEIRKFLRDDGIIKVSRSVKELNAGITAFSREYELRHGESPTLACTAKALGVTEESVVYAAGAPSFVYSLDGAPEDGDVGIAEKTEDKNSFSEEKITDRILINDILSGLKPRDRQIIIMRYYMDMSQEEVAKKVSLSQVQVSRIEKKILEAARKKCIIDEP